MCLCLYDERGALVVVLVTDAKVGVIEERLLGGVESDEDVSSSEKSVKVDMPLEEAITDGADLWKTLERRLRPLDSANVVEEAGDGRSYGPLRSLFLRDLVAVEYVLDADEPQNVTEELVDEGVGSPGSELWPNSS